jgi:hypothetical protein
MAMATYWNYVDALAYALALNASDEGEKFTADPSRWNKAVYQLRERYEGKLPEAFRDIFFEVRPGRPVYSPQVDHFLHVLAQARLMSEPNPAYVVLEISPSHKQAIIRLNEERLSQHQELLQEIGKDFSSLVRQGDGS